MLELYLCLMKTVVLLLYVLLGKWGPSVGEDVSGDYLEILFMLMMCFNVVSYLLYRNPRRILDLVV